MNSNLIIEYKILIKNIGDTEGYAYLIKDYLPENTEFISELNPDWYLEDEILYSSSLTHDVIKPEATKELKLILTKQIEQDKAETIINEAEILSTFNDKLLEEQDLENNLSQAKILISIKTGQEKTYIILTITVLTIITLGAYIIKKKVLI